MKNGKKCECEDKTKCECDLPTGDDIQLSSGEEEALDLVWAEIYAEAERERSERENAINK